MEDTEVNLSLNIKPLSTMDKLKSNGIEFLKTLQYWFTFIGLGMGNLPFLLEHKFII